MSDHHPHEEFGARGPGLSRRRVLQGMVALAAFGGTGLRAAAAAPLPPRPPSVDGLAAYALAMHLHASASEGIGSMRAQLAQAALNGFDVAWFTEHDWRRRRLLFRGTYHFLANDSAYGGVWKLPKLAATGSLTKASGGALVASPVSPNDPATTKGALRLRATSTGAAAGTVRFHLDATTSSRANYAGRMSGRTLSVDVLPTRSSANAWAELLVSLSRQVASGSRPAGQISMLYRLRTDISARAYSSLGTQGIVDVPVPPGSWTTVTVDPAGDVLAIWPDLDPRDNALNDIEFHATSRAKAPAEVYFSYLHLDEQPGALPQAVGVEQGIVAGYAAQVAPLLGFVGTEISLDVHLNQFGGTQADFPYPNPTALGQSYGDLRTSIVDFIHANGGLASINHAFQPGDSSIAANPTAVALDLLGRRAAGADILEVGYAAKGTNGTLANHLAVWDTLSRNAVFVTGTGVSDDHGGNSWATQANRFYTGVWAPATTEPALMAALAAGRSYVGFLGGFSGTVDMSVDSADMGSVLVDPDTASRTVRMGVTGVPAGGTVQLLRGAVDYAGTAAPVPDTAVVAQYTADQLAANDLLPVDGTQECFYRLQVLDGSGAVVAFGQPIWLLHTAPSTGVPAARQV